MQPKGAKFNMVKVFLVINVHNDFTLYQFRVKRWRNKVKWRIKQFSGNNEANLKWKVNEQIKWAISLIIIRASSAAMRTWGCSLELPYSIYYPARALGLLLADGTPTVGGGKTFWAVSQIFFTETAVTPERKVEKWFPRWEINRHAEG